MGLNKRERAVIRSAKDTKKRKLRRTSKDEFNRLIEQGDYEEVDNQEFYRRGRSETGSRNHGMV